MIVSKKHRYVFVEVPHTGSTAISRELRSEYDGEKILRKHSTYRDFLQHASKDEREFFAFAAVRNPMDIAVTRFFRMKTQIRGDMSDSDFIAKRGSIAQKFDLRVERWVEKTDADFTSFLMRWYRVPFDSWTSLDQDRYDYVMRFERLSADFESALRQIGIEPLRPLPPANVTKERDSDFTKYFSGRATKRAVWVFGPYMEKWGYSFPPEWGAVRIPWWSRVLYRVARVPRSIYWRFLRFRNPRRPTQLTSLWGP